MDTMSPSARPSGMTPDEFTDLLVASGLNQTQAAELLGVTRRTIVRWVAAVTPISIRSARHIQATIKPLKKRK